MSGGVPVTNAGVVVVVGLGPTGLAVALMLSSWGVHVVAVDPNVSPCPEPRAASMDDLAQRLLARECPAVSAHVQGLATQLVTSAGAPLYNLAPTPGVHGCCEVGFFFQPDVEAELRSTLNARPTVDTRYGWCAEAVHEDRDSVRVDLVGPDAGRCTVVAAFVLGCDGAASVVRRAAALQLAGTTLDAAGSWLVCDVKLPHGSVRDALGALESARHSTLMQSFRFVCDPARPGLDLPLPNGHARFEWLLDSPDHPTPPDAVLRQWLRARGVSEAVACGVEFVRRARYVFHARQATPHWHSHSRRLIVAGDAAHLTPPMRGQGLSSGIADAANVAWKLALVLRGVAPLVIVDSYEAERRHRVVANTHVAVWLSRLIASRRCDLGQQETHSHIDSLWLQSIFLHDPRCHHAVGVGVDATATRRFHCVHYAADACSRARMRSRALSGRGSYVRADLVVRSAGTRRFALAIVLPRCGPRFVLVLASGRPARGRPSPVVASRGWPLRTPRWRLGRCGTPRSRCHGCMALSCARHG